MSGERRLFIAGSTGATGKMVTKLALEKRYSIVPHVRPKSASKVDYPNPVLFELSDEDALGDAMQGCTTVLQLVGTMRKRFKLGDTYETSDIGTTRHLVKTALEVSVDHLIILTSVGAGRPIGSYLKAKAKAEKICQDSGIPTTVIRPSFLDGPGRRAPFGMKTLSRMMILSKYRWISLTDLSQLILYLGMEKRCLSENLEGPNLWKEISNAREYFS